MKILFLHGIGSGENSRTAEILREAGYEVLAPELPVSPVEANNFIWEQYLKFNPDLIVGNSLGGFYALRFCNVPVLVINPAINAPKDIETAIGYGEHNFVKPRNNGQLSYVIDEKFISELKALFNVWSNYIALDEENRPNVFGIFGTNDTVLNDYSLFTKFYGAENAKLIPAEHRLEAEEVRTYVLPMIEDIKNNYGII